VSTPQSS